jgi:hypothetical protein
MMNPNERCKTICGDDISGCFIFNSSHIECISDIIINKVWSAREMIDMGASRNRNQEMSEILEMATAEMDRLIIWVQNLKAMQRSKEIESSHVPAVISEHQACGR